MYYTHGKKANFTSKQTRNFLFNIATQCLIFFPSYFSPLFLLKLHKTMLLPELHDLEMFAAAPVTAFQNREHDMT